jgi:anti-sigma B factor antagonist
MNLELIELEDGIRLIKLIGTLDLTATYSIEVEFVRHCEGETLHVLVDLAEVDYISSIGVHMLVRTAMSVAKRGGKMALLNPQRDVMDVLELTGILQRLPVYSDLASAKSGLLAA